MLRFFRRSSDETIFQPAIPPGHRVYAIGDIHGRDDLFAALLDSIRADDAARPAADTTLILLGDLIDRGPQSAAVVERAVNLSLQWPSVEWLIGNHEEIFLDVLDGAPTEKMRFFLKIGGDATVHSYGISGDNYRSMDFHQLSLALRRAVPTVHRDFLRRGSDRIIIGDYLFVHAGIRPDIDIDSQSIADLRWIRREFIQHREPHDLMVVHGHNITDVVDSPGNRIGIDTGAYASGVLTAIGLEGTDRWFLDTSDR